MKIVLCDDDPQVLQELGALLFGFFEERKIQVACCAFADGESVVSEMVSYDFAFIDVEMSGMNGLAVAKLLQEYNPNIIIFMVTSYPHYLDDSMDLNVFRYLTKPVAQERLRRGMDIALQKYHRQNQSILLDTVDGGSLPVFTKDILYICIHGRGTLVKTKAKDYLTHTPIKQWATQLNADLFSGPHYSYLVNMQNVLSLRKKEVIMLDDDAGNPVAVAIAQRKYEMFKKSFARYIGGVK